MADPTEPRYDPSNSGTCLARTKDGVWDAQGRPVSNLPTPEEPSDAATKGYVDTMISRTTQLWSCSTNPAMADPGAGRLRFNQATAAESTELALSATSDGGTDVSAALGRLLGGDFVTMQDQDDATRWVRYTLRSPPAAMSPTWWRLSVALLDVSAAELIQNNHALVVQMAESPAATRSALLARRH